MRIRIQAGFLNIGHKKYVNKKFKAFEIFKIFIQKNFENLSSFEVTAPDHFFF